MITQEQALQIIQLFKTAYKESYRDVSPKEAEQKAAIYRDILQDYTFEQVQAGIRAYMSEDHQYEPKPGQIIVRIRGNIGNLDELAAEAWGEVWKKIICRASVATLEDYNALPELTRKVVPFGLLLTWGKAEDPGAESFARRDFMNDYKILLAREQARQAIPRAALEVLQHSAEPEKLEAKAADSAIKPGISDGRAAGKPAEPEKLRKLEEHHTSYTDTEEYQRRRAELYKRLKE